MNSSPVIYVSNQCPNCSRFLDTIRRIPSLRDRTRVVDIDTLPRERRERIEFVPMFVDSHGATHTGSKAFDQLKQYVAEMELECAPSNGGSLAFGSIGDNGGLDYTGFYSDFVAPP